MWEVQGLLKKPKGPLNAMAAEIPAFAHLAPGQDPAELVCGWVERHLNLGHDIQDLTIMASSVRLLSHLRKELSRQRRGFLPEILVVDERMEAEEDGDGLVDAFSWLMEVLAISASDYPHIPHSVQARTKLADDMLTIFDEWISDDVAKPRLTDGQLLPGRIAKHASFLVEIYGQFRGMLMDARHPTYRARLAPSSSSSWAIFISRDPPSGSRISSRGS